MCQIDSLTRIFESTQQPLSISWSAEATLEKLPWRSLRAGDVLVWVGIVHARKVKWKELRRRGVYTVYYQTEPMARVGRKVVNAMHTPRAACRALTRELPTRLGSAPTPCARCAELMNSVI